jgi:hypothetical protein
MLFRNPETDGIWGCEDGEKIATGAKYVPLIKKHINSAITPMFNTSSMHHTQTSAVTALYDLSTDPKTISAVRESEKSSFRRAVPPWSVRAWRMTPFFRTAPGQVILSRNNPGSLRLTAPNRSIVRAVFI